MSEQQRLAAAEAALAALTAKYEKSEATKKKLREVLVRHRAAMRGLRRQI